MSAGTKCPHCGLIHETTCSRIKSIEYHPDGSIKRVEFLDGSASAWLSMWQLPTGPAPFRGGSKP